MTSKEMNKRTDKTTIDKIQRCLFGIAIMVVSLFNVPGMRAEGSKELNPEGVKGNRAFLISMTGQYAFNPFATTGRMMVYAEVGETIYVGSSSQGFGAGTINLYSPSELFVLQETVLPLAVFKIALRNWRDRLHSMEPVIPPSP